MLFHDVTPFVVGGWGALNAEDSAFNDKYTLH